MGLPRKRKGDADLAEELFIEGFVVAGTEPAHALLGVRQGEHPQCIRCGSPLLYTFVTSKGPMGGDCLATVTGDQSTRKLAKKVLEGVKKAKMYVKAPLQALEVTKKPYQAAGGSINLLYRGDDYDSWDGTYSSKSWFLASFKRGQEDFAVAVASFIAEQEGLDLAITE